MATITPTVCRNFVNSVINCYDGVNLQRNIFAPEAFPDLENLSEMVEPTNPEESRKPKYNDEQKLAICAKEGVGRLYAVTKAFDSFNWDSYLLIENVLAARLKQLIQEGAIDLASVQKANLYGSNTLLFLSHMFGTVFAGASLENRVAIVNQLQHFDAKLNTYSFWFERKVLKIQKTIVAYTPNVSEDYKDALYTLITLVVSVSLYAIGTTLQPRVVQFFAATAVSQARNLFHITAINLFYEKTRQLTAGLVACVVNNRVYYWIVRSPPLYFMVAQVVAFVVILKVLPVRYVAMMAQAMAFINFSKLPPWVVRAMLVGFAGKFIYDSYFSPAAKFQQRVAQSLATTLDSPEKERRLEEGIKAYQVWMYLMNEGIQQKLFSPATGD